MRIPQHLIDEVAARADIVDIVGEYVSLTQRGDRYWGLSPFKAERTASFSVVPDRRFYYCFSTSQGGNVFDFVMKMENLTFPEAVRHVAAKVGVQIPDEDSRPDDPAYRQQKAIEDLYERVARSFHHILLHSAEADAARTYCRDRGISDESIATFLLGYSPRDPQWLYAFLRKKGYSEDFLAGCGLFTRKNPRRALFTDRILFPIADRRGRTVAFGGRVLGDREPKYLNSPESDLFRKRDNLYGLPQALTAIRGRRHAVICEGYVDVIALHQAGIKECVAPLGTALTLEQLRGLSKACDRVTLLFDGDDAGRRAARRSAVLCETVGLIPAVVELPAGVDPGDFVRLGDAQRLRDVVHSGDAAIEVLVNWARETENDNAERVSALAMYVNAIQSPVRKREAQRLIAERLELVEEDVGKEIDRVVSAGVSGGSRRRDSPSHPTRGNTQPPPDPRAEPPAATSKRSSTVEAKTVDLHLMLAVAAHPDSFGEVRSRVEIDDLEDKRAQDVYLALEESHRAGVVSTEAIIARIESDDVRDMTIKAIAEGVYDAETEQYIRTAILSVRERTLKRQRATVQSQLRRADRSGDSARILRLQEEKMFLDRALQDLTKRMSSDLAS